MFSFLVLFFSLYFWFDSLLLEDSDWWYKSEWWGGRAELNSGCCRWGIGQPPGSYFVFVATLHFECYLYIFNTSDVQFHVNMKLIVWFGRFPAFALFGLHTWHVTCWFCVVAVLLLGCKQVFTEWLNYGCFPFYLNALFLLFCCSSLSPPCPTSSFGLAADEWFSKGKLSLPGYALYFCFVLLSWSRSSRIMA